MEFTVKPFVLLLSLTSSSPLAYSQTPNFDIDALVTKINRQTQALEQQVSQLKCEVKRLQTAQIKKAPIAVTVPLPVSEDTETRISPIGALLAKQSIVTIAPYVGILSQLDASDTIAAQANYNLDQTLLVYNEALVSTAKNDHITISDSPSLVLSGEIASQVYGSKTYSGPNTSDIDLTIAELFAAVRLNSWIAGLITLNYNDAPPSDNEQRVSNSSFSVNQAFATIGNFSVSPFYMTVGQRYLPFGHYNSFMISSPLDDTMFQLLERSILWGYTSQNTTAVIKPYATTFIFKDDTNAGGGGDNVNNMGVNLGVFLTVSPNISGEVGVSGVANVADGNGFQRTGLTTFPGFSISDITTASNTSVNGEDLSRKVPGFNAYGSIGTSDIMLIGEYTGATSSFAADNLTYNGHGAKPSAMHTEAVYLFNLANFPSNVAVGYDHTWQALALNMPQQRYITALNMTFWRNTVTSFEVNRWINYAKGDIATGMDSPEIQVTGHYQTNITLQFSVYF